MSFSIKKGLILLIVIISIILNIKYIDAIRGPCPGGCDCKDSQYCKMYDGYGCWPVYSYSSKCDKGYQCVNRECISPRVVGIKNPNGGVVASNTCYSNSCSVSYSSCGQVGWYTAWFATDGQSTSTNAYYCGCVDGTYQYGSSCGNCGTLRRYCSGGSWGGWSCVEQGVCSQDSTRCIDDNKKYQICSSSCSWQDTGTDADNDGYDVECGDSQCDNVPGVYDSTKTDTETNCEDGLDNDCDSLTDTEDSDCCINIKRECRLEETEHGKYACELDDTDVTCCDDVNSCVYNGVCYPDGTIKDVDDDGMLEKCIARSPGFWITAFEIICDDGIDNDYDGLTDCEDPDCDGNITGYVKNQDSSPLEGAKVEVFQGSTKVAEDPYTEPDGSYEINIACGTYNLAASKTDYLPDTRSNVIVPPRTTIQENFTLTYGIVCEDDCSYLLDDVCHEECDGVNGCSFYDETAKEKCNLAQVGWEVEYDEDNFIECCEGLPQERTEIGAVPSCPYENLVKFYRIVHYKGKPIRMVTVVCGD
jgi:hypothetical protein